MATTLQEADREAGKCVNDHTWSNGIIGFVPASTLVITPKQAYMIKQVADIYGVKHYSTDQLLTMIGTAVAGMTASEVLSLIPVVGWIAKGAAASSVTKAAGEIVIGYMRDQSPLR